MKKGLLFIFILYAYPAQAIKENIVWNQPVSRYSHLVSDKTIVQLSLKKKQHVRIAQKYQGIEIFGYSLSLHFTPNAPLITGIEVQNLAKDIPSTTPVLSFQEVINRIGLTDKTPQILENKTVVFIDPHKKAHLAYTIHLTSEDPRYKAHHFIVDSTQGHILSHWSDMTQQKIGQGLGGNSLRLPYRGGAFQYGQVQNERPSLDKLDVELNNSVCLMQNKNIRVISLQDEQTPSHRFPVSADMEQNLNIQAYRYDCQPDTGYINANDTLHQNGQEAYSPVNDAMYFGQKTVDMFSIYYGVSQPFGDDLPIRLFTHIGKYDNAFAIPTLKTQNKIFSHQQIIIGNGDQFLLAPTQTVVAHELAHIFTSIHSGLIYSGQSGAINESFSDMAVIALKDFISQSFSWYWNKDDWTIGQETVLSGAALRHMDSPNLDGYSIEHAKDWHDEMNVHHASGVFNKAFYILAHQPGFSTQKAFQVMVDANLFYWSKISYYDFAACGVIQAALNRHYPIEPVKFAFEAVGVHCPIKLPIT